MHNVAQAWEKQIGSESKASEIIRPVDNLVHETDINDIKKVGYLDENKYGQGKPIRIIIQRDIKENENK